MATIVCTECWEKISDEAKICPHCGCPITHFDKNDNVKKKSYLKRGILVWFLIPVELIVILAAVVVMNSNSAGNIVETMIWGSLFLNIVLSGILAVKCGKGINRSANAGEKIPAKNIIAMLLTIAFALLNTSVVYQALLGRQRSITGEWKSSLTDELTLCFIYEESGDFYSYAIMNGSNVPGGEGTYVCEDGIVITTMDSGEVTRSEYEITGNKLKLNDLVWEREGVMLGGAHTVFLLFWVSFSIFCYFIMKSKGYPKNICWAHCVGGLLMGVIWLLVVLYKKPYSDSVDSDLNCRPNKTANALWAHIQTIFQSGISRKEQKSGDSDHVEAEANVAALQGRENEFVCPECKERIESGCDACPCCGFPLSDLDEFGVSKVEQAAKNIKASLQKLGVRKIIALVVGVILVFTAIRMVSSDSFRYNLENYEYYKEQAQDNYEEALSGGMFSGTYAFVAKEWEDMYIGARNYVIVHGVMAAALFVSGIGIVFVGCKKKGRK